MTAPTSSWNLVRVFGTWRGMDGALKAGTYKVSIPARITNVTDDAIIPAGQYASGALQVAVSGSPSLDLLVPATDDPDNAETGWKVTVDVTFPDATAERYVIDVPVANRPIPDGGNGNGVNLRTCAMPTTIPQQVALYKVGVPGGLAQLDGSGQVIDANGDPVTGGGLSTVASTDITDATAVGRSVLTSSSATAARTAIGAGTSSLQLGVGPTTAKAGDYVPTWTEITSKPTTFAPTIGATGSTAVAGNDARLTDARTPTAHTHPASQVSDSTATGRSLLTAADAAAARTAIGAGTSSLALGTTSATAKAGDYQPTAANISDSTATGRSVLTAASASAARAALGAGTSDLALGTTGSTAKAGNYAPTLADIPAGLILVAPLDGSVNTNAGLARPSSRTDIFFRWRSTVQPTNMLTGDEWLVAP